jgi:hypothetical protein
MTDLDRASLDRIMPAVAGAPDWNDVLGRSRAHERRQRVITLAAAALVAVIATASAFGVRAFVLDKGFIGLPPVGATPSAPENAELVLSYFGAGPEGTGGKRRSWLYADGRLVWLQDGSFPEGASPDSTGFLEQRLTPEGVELLRSEALSTGHWGDESPPPPLEGPPCPRGVSPGTVVPPATVGCLAPTPPPSPDEPVTVPFWLFVEAPGAGRLNRVDHARDLDRLVERLADPASWLPPDAWASREVRAYVPSRFSVCFGAWDADPPLSPERVLDLLPAAAGDLLRGRTTTRFETLVGTPGNYHPEVDACADLPTEQARRLTDVLDASGFERWMPSYRLAYRSEDATSGREIVHLYLEPYLPHGETTCSACG